MQLKGLKVKQIKKVDIETGGSDKGQQIRQFYSCILVETDRDITVTIQKPDAFTGIAPGNSVDVVLVQTQKILADFGKVKKAKKQEV
jgi:hypothetical protein